jgi:hypothetical protein
MVQTALLVLGILVLIGATYSYYWYSPAPPVPPLSATIRQATMSVCGRERTYLIYVPAGLPPQAALVIVLYGPPLLFEIERVFRFLDPYPQTYPRRDRLKFSLPKTPALLVHFVR